MRPPYQDGVALAFSIGASAGVFALLAACSSFMQEQPGISYAKSVVQLGIYPVYPPREDIQVGDLYGMEDNARLDPSKLHSVFVRTIDMTPEIKDYLAHRYVFRDTTTSLDQGEVTGLSAAVPNQTDAPTGGKVLDRSPLQDLPIAGFPAIEVDSGLSIGIEGAPPDIAAIFGFAAAKTEKMTLHFGMVTSYSVPTEVALDKLRAFCHGPPYNDIVVKDCGNDNLSILIDEKFQLGTNGPKTVRTAHPLLVSKVYLARAISYTFNDATLAAAAAGVAGGNGKAAPPIVNGNLLSAAVASDDPAMVSALANFQSALNSTVDSSQQNTQGVSFSLSGYDRNSVTFQEIFQRPVVVGYEGVYVQPVNDRNAKG